MSSYMPLSGLQGRAAVFPMEWLTPCVLVYTQRGYASSLNTSGKEMK